MKIASIYQLKPDQLTALLAGAVDATLDDRGVQPWRIDGPRRRLCHPDVVARAMDAVGIRLAMDTDSTTLSVGVDPCLDLEPIESMADWTFDLLIDGDLYDRQTHPRKPTELNFTGWPAGTHRLELFLYHVSPIRLTGAAVDAGASVEPARDDRPRWVVYGSSITQCGAAIGPSETWPAMVARRRNLHHINLGFGGLSQLDQPVARMIAGMPADYISVCFSVNNFDQYTPRTFGPAVTGFLQTIRDGHPDTPIACVSPILWEPFETTPSASKLTLVTMRETVASAIDALRAVGDDRLTYTDGLELFGLEQRPLMPDGLHPGAEGYRVLADRYDRLVMPSLLAM